MAGQSCVEYLAESYAEVAPLVFYRAVFPEGCLDKRDAFTKGKYCGVAVQIEGQSKVKRYTITDELDNLEELLGSDVFTVISPISYAGKTQKSEFQRDCYGVAVDLDNVINEDGKPWGLIDLLAHIEDAKFIPAPTYIVASSPNNLHLYYLLDKPIPLYQSNKESLARYKTYLTSRIWNSYTTYSYKETQQEPIGQGMRAVGSISKNGKDRVRAFKYGDRVSIDYLNSFCIKPEQLITVWDGAQKDKKKEKAERKATLSNPHFYEWYKKQILIYAVDGRRYFDLMVMAIIAKKCGIPFEQLEKEALDLVPEMDIRTRRDGNNFTKDDALKAITAYNVPHFMFMKRETMVRLSGVPMEPCKRNGRPQDVHLKIARGNKAVLNSVGIGHAQNAGAPIKKDLVLDYKAKHPDKSNRQIAVDLGISRNTVNKWLKPILEATKKIMVELDKQNNER